MRDRQLGSRSPGKGFDGRGVDGIGDPAGDADKPLRVVEPSSASESTDAVFPRVLDTELGLLLSRGNPFRDLSLFLLKQKWKSALEQATTFFSSLLSWQYRRAHEESLCWEHNLFNH